jgi:hypothetical protein
MTRYAIVEEIVRFMPDFEANVRLVGNIWKQEDRRIGLFDAVALALGFYREHGSATG